MQVEVFHEDKHVATVQAPQGDDMAALEYAWRWTNNVEGSWSQGPELTLRSGSRIDNLDYNPAVTFKAPLVAGLDGRVLGHRSSMVGDRFVVVDGGSRRDYEVARRGFVRLVGA